MTGGFGLELTSAGVSGTVATTATDRQPVVHVPAVGFVDGDGLNVGDEAARLALATPTSAVHDIVSEFTVDRLWFVGGRMITPDDALGALMGAVVARLAGTTGESPGAATISCPPEWGEDTRDRVVEVARSLTLPLPEVMTGVDVHAAAAHAAHRCPVRGLAAPADTSFDLPPLESAVTGTRSPVSMGPAHAGSVRAYASGRPRRGGLAVVATSVVIVGTLGAMARGGDGTDAMRPTPSTAGTVAPTVIPTSEPVVPRALTLGLVSDGLDEPTVREAVAELSTAGGVLGNDVFLVVQPGDTEPAGAVQQLVSQGVNALITDIVDDRLDALTAEAQAADLIVCASRPPIDAQRTGIVVGDALSCATFLALSAIEAGASDAARLGAAAHHLLAASGIACTNFASCRAYLEAHQPISYSPDSGPLRSAPTE